MRPTLLTTIIATALVGCGSDPQPATPLDAGVDAAVVDVAALDAPAAVDVDVVRVSPDVPLPGECNNVEIEDLVELGTLDGEVTRLSGDNRGRRSSNTVGLQPPAAFAPVCNFRSTYQRVFRYVTRRAGSLRVSTANAGTTATFDTTLAVLAMRACVANPRDLFCNNDDPTATAASRNRFASRVATSGTRSTASAKHISATPSSELSENSCSSPCTKPARVLPSPRARMPPANRSASPCDALA